MFQYEATKASADVVAKLAPFRGTLTADAEHRFNAVYQTGRVVESFDGTRPLPDLASRCR